MAQMFPEALDSTTRSDAECLLYECFQQQLDEYYLVFHSVHWLGLNERRQPQDGEADFVIAHPEQGILVIEVKGGGISRNLATGKWTTRDRYGVVSPIKNPVKQAMKNKHALLEQLKKVISSYINIGHAVAFPDINARNYSLGPDLPQDIVLDANNLNQLAT